MPWVEIFAVLFVSHLTGDYLLQTEWQATHKRGGLTGSAESRRALTLHVATYTLAFVPALVWLGDDIGALEAIGVGALIAVPHFVQDDGRLVDRYARSVKGVTTPPPGLLAMIDQSFHVVALFLVALLAGSWA